MSPVCESSVDDVVISGMVAGAHQRQKLGWRKVSRINSFVIAEPERARKGDRGYASLTTEAHDMHVEIEILRVRQHSLVRRIHVHCLVLRNLVS